MPYSLDAVPPESQTSFQTMTDKSQSTTDTGGSTSSEQTPWSRLADADPIEIHDSLAELLGMLPEEATLTITFADVVTAAGHACPAVAGAYRGTQLALEELYPDSPPVRSQLKVVVGGPPDASGYGPMANVIRHITGAADETGFRGFNGYGGRANLLSFEELPGPGRSFKYTRRDTDETARLTFDPSVLKPASANEGHDMNTQIGRLVQGDLSADERDAFYERWHTRVEAILQADPEPNSPFTVETSNSTD